MTAWTADHAIAHTAAATTPEANTVGIANLLAIRYPVSSVGSSTRVARYVALRRWAVRRIRAVLMSVSIRSLFTYDSQYLMGIP